MPIRNYLLGIAAILLASTSIAFAQDHPLLGHLEGSTPKGYQENEFDEARLIFGPMDEALSLKRKRAFLGTFSG